MIDFSVRPARVQPPLNVVPFHAWRFEDGTLWTEFYRCNDTYLLRFPDLADFQIPEDGMSVTCIPAPGVSDTVSQHLYLNQVRPLALSKLGKLVFHASAVELGEGAISFVAPSGRGKSTLAASFAVAGFHFLTDDGLMLEWTDDGYLVLPSHPSVRLWEDSEEALIGAGTRRAPALEYTSKSRFLAGNDIPFCDRPRAFRHAYFLGESITEEITFRRLNEPDALVEWVKHSFLLDVEDKSMLGDHFACVAKLANVVPCYQLDYPRRFEDLDDLRHAIIDHAASQGSAHGFK